MKRSSPSSSPAPSIKPAPYYSTPVTRDERWLAGLLRADIVPALRRRLPYHHLGGLQHGWVIKFVQKFSSTYPFFLRTDIRKFYPSVKHRDIVVCTQVAYRDLLGLDFVPFDFSRKYVGGLNRWLLSLPLEHRGIPLASPLSCLTAPLMLVPLWLKLKRNFKVPIAIYMDDILILSKSEQEINQIHQFLHNNLHHDYDLDLNVEKTQSGRFSTGKLTYCGWHFAGGSARVADPHIESFKSRIHDVVARSSNITRPQLIKRLNRKIDGFGNYYKSGSVKRQYEALDIYIRSLVRPLLVGKTRCETSVLSSMGLRSLCGIYSKYQDKHNPFPLPKKTPSYLKKVVHSPPKPNTDEQILLTLNAISEKLTQLLSAQKHQLYALERLFHL